MSAPLRGATKFYKMVANIYNYKDKEKGLQQLTNRCIKLLQSSGGTCGPASHTGIIRGGGSSQQDIKMSIVIITSGQSNLTKRPHCACTWTAKKKKEQTTA